MQPLLPSFEKMHQMVFHQWHPLWRKHQFRKTMACHHGRKRILYQKISHRCHYQTTHLRDFLPVSNPKLIEGLSLSASSCNGDVPNFGSTAKGKIDDYNEKGKLKKDLRVSVATSPNFNDAQSSSTAKNVTDETSQKVRRCLPSCLLLIKKEDSVLLRVLFSLWMGFHLVSYWSVNPFIWQINLVSHVAPSGDPNDKTSKEIDPVSSPKQPSFENSLVFINILEA